MGEEVSECEFRVFEEVANFSYHFKKISMNLSFKSLPVFFFHLLSQDFF